MRRHSRPWREDRLAADLRAAFARYRRAEPSDAVWTRVAREIEPRRARRASMPAASALSVLILAVMAFTSLSAQVGSVSPRSELTYADSLYAHGLTPIEEEVARRAMEPGPLDMRLPPNRNTTRTIPVAPREAFNRSTWLGNGPAASVGGTVHPLQAVAGL
jgi:hypothetical protein